MSGPLVGVRGTHPDLGDLDMCLIYDQLVYELDAWYDGDELARVQDALAGGDTEEADRVAAGIGLALGHDQAALAARMADALADELGPEVRQVVRASALGPALSVDVEHGGAWDRYRLAPEVVRLLVDRYGLVYVRRGAKGHRWVRPDHRWARPRRRGGVMFLPDEVAEHRAAVLAEEWLAHVPGVADRIHALPPEVAAAVMAAAGYDTPAHQQLVGGLGDRAWTRVPGGWTKTEGEGP